MLKQTEIPEGKERKDSRVNDIFERYEGTDVTYCVPSFHDGRPVTKIAAKAFLSCKTIQKLEMPDTVTEIGDWAFAHMKNLQELVLPFRMLAYGKKPFLDCEQLKKITVRGGTAKTEGVFFLLASAVTVLEQPGLCQPGWAGDAKRCAQWLEAYDKALEEYLDSSDEEGFEPVFIGWFHVEDMDEQMPRHMEKRRKNKIRLILQRLRYREHLSEKLKKRMFDYLASHMPDGKERDEHTLVPDVICDEEEYRNQVCYMKILQESGSLNWENIQYFLERLQGAAPEVMAYLVQLLQEKGSNDEFFMGLEL